MSRALLALAVCLALALAGCGGGSDDSASTASATPEVTNTPQASRQATSTTGQEQGGAKQGKKSSTGKGENSQRQSKGPGQGNAFKPHPKVPPISSAPVAGSKAPAPGVKTVKGADNSVQEYGVESDEPERREAAIALQAYLNARAEEDWGAACSYLAKRPMEQLQRLQDAAAKQGTELDGCAQTMALLKEGEGQEQAASTITEVLSLRGGGEVSGDPSYLIYIAPPANTLYSMPMYSQGGAWKVGLARAAELPVG